MRMVCISRCDVISLQIQLQTSREAELPLSWLTCVRIEDKARDWCRARSVSAKEATPRGSQAGGSLSCAGKALLSCQQHPSAVAMAAMKSGPQMCKSKAGRYLQGRSNGPGPSARQCRCSWLPAWRRSQSGLWRVVRG